MSNKSVCLEDEAVAYRWRSLSAVERERLADPATARGIQGEHNVAGTWQGNFRVGHLDLVMLRYALEVNCLSDIALTWLDGLGPTMKICTHYESDDHPGHRINELSTIVLSEARTRALMRMRPVYETIDSLDLLKILKDRLGVRVVLTSCGPTHESKIIYTEPSR